MFFFGCKPLIKSDHSGHNITRIIDWLVWSMRGQTTDDDYHSLNPSERAVCIDKAMKIHNDTRDVIWLFINAFHCHSINQLHSCHILVAMVSYAYHKNKWVMNGMNGKKVGIVHRMYALVLCWGERMVPMVEHINSLTITVQYIVMLSMMRNGDWLIRQWMDA